MHARAHGQPPYRVVVVHGGPGAAGDLFAVARRLATRRGVLEPRQTAASVGGQVSELTTQILRQTDPPVTLIGHSWGAWLAALVAADYPDLVRKLILVGSGALEEKYVPMLRARRMERLTSEERTEFESLAQQLNEPDPPSGALTRLGELAARTDVADPVDVETAPYTTPTDGQSIYGSVWPEAAAMRRDGQLLSSVCRVACPVVAIHGDFDPTPVEAVREPLERCGIEFRIAVLERCGHEPWRERNAAEAFYALLEDELRGDATVSFQQEVTG
jgi:pimeloyl-ACP methyl ester carboxylesterase